ncbi:hypothetical protein Tco_1325628 [Tanacetum coccineum]
MASGGKDRDAKDALFKLLQMGTVTEYESRILQLWEKPSLELESPRLVLREKNPAVDTIVGDQEDPDVKGKQEAINETVDTITSLQSEVTSLEAKRSLDANEEIKETRTRVHELEKQVEKLPMELFKESVKNRFGPSKYEDPKGALSKLLQLGTVEDYQREFEKLMNRLLVSIPTTLGDAFSLARITEARFEVIAEKEQNIKEKAYTTLTFPSEEASPVVKGPLDASEDTLLSLRSEDPNFKIQEKAIEYVRALNAAPLKVVFVGSVDEVSGVIEDVFDIDESNVEGMQDRDKFAEFFEDKGSVEKVLSATKLPKCGNSHSSYSPYHLEDKVNFEGMGNVTPWAAKVERRKRVKCYAQGSGRRKRKKVIGRGSERRIYIGGGGSCWWFMAAGLVVEAVLGSDGGGEAWW